MEGEKDQLHTALLAAQPRGHARMRVDREIVDHHQQASPRPPPAQADEEGS